MEDRVLNKLTKISKVDNNLGRRCLNIIDENRKVLDTYLVACFFLTSGLCMIISPLLERYTTLICLLSLICCVLSSLFYIRFYNLKSKINREIKSINKEIN